MNVTIQLQAHGKNDIKDIKQYYYKQGYLVPPFHFYIDKAGHYVKVSELPTATDTKAITIIINALQTVSDKQKTMLNRILATLRARYKNIEVQQNEQS